MLGSWPFRRRSALQRRVDRLARVFSIDPVLAQSMGAAQVAEYYDLSFGAYRRRHSSEGALHLALNEDGRFDPTGFGGQVDRLMRAWQGGPVATVLELGFGHGYNLAALATRMPGTVFSGVDLTPRHVQHTQALLIERGIANVEVNLGDFHRLPWADASFDHVFSVEAFCHARDVPQALAEVARVLRPGGTLTLFDGYLPRPAKDMQDDEAMALTLSAKGMAMDQWQVADELLAQARAVGLKLQTRTVLDAQVMPSVRRLDRLCAAFMRWPWLARRALARLNPVAMRNVLAGYLVVPAISRGVWNYLELVMRRDDGRSG